MSNTNNNQKISERANEKYCTRLAWTILYALVIYSFILIDKISNTVSINKAYLALGIIWLGMLPTVKYLLNNKRSPLPYFPLVGIFYASGFGLPIFITKEQKESLFSIISVSNEALFLVLLGLAEMNIAFYVFQYILRNRIIPIQLVGESNTDKLIRLLMIFIFTHILFIYIDFIKTIPSLGQLLEPIGFIAYGMFFILWSRGQLSSVSLKIFISICFFLEVLKRFTSGLLAEVMILFLFLFLIIWCEKKRIPIIFIGFITIFFIFFSSGKTEYRKLTWNGDYSDINTIEKAKLFVELTIQRYTEPSNRLKTEDEFESSTNSIVDRTAQIALFSRVMDDTPRLVPYWNGQTYLPVFTSFIPRILWINKPIENTGNVFGKRYNYLDNNDDITSINLPLIVEMYANFGELGVIIGMPLLGIFLAFIDLKFNSSKMNSLDLVIGATILVNLIFQESNLSLITGSLITLYLTLYFIFKYYIGSEIKLKKYDNKY